MAESNQQSTENQPKLKVCGLTRADQIQELISINVDFLGFIFYEKSPRFILGHLSLSEISKINHHGKVGVFVNENSDKMIEIAEKADLNFIQLHGDENEKDIFRLTQRLSENVKIIKVIRIGDQNAGELQKTINKYPSIINYLLFDTDSKAFGGTGKTFDWNILNKINVPLPYFLSGGISSENADNLKILNQKPFVLDINSKFEIEPGIKNLDKIKKLVDILKVPKGRPNKE